MCGLLPKKDQHPKPSLVLQALLISLWLVLINGYRINKWEPLLVSVQPIGQAHSSDTRMFWQTLTAFTSSYVGM